LDYEYTFKKLIKRKISTTNKQTKNKQKTKRKGKERRENNDMKDFFHH